MSADVAAFDLDGTLTVRDTVLPFVREVVGARQFVRGLPAMLPCLAARGLGLLDPTTTKERLFTRYLRGHRLDDVAAAGRRFARERMPAMLRAAALRRLHWHKAEGHRCFVVTASAELYVTPWAAGIGIETIASRLEVDAEGRLTGRHHGAACDGPEKLRRLKEIVGGEPFVLHAYGDSKGDAELLAAARHAYWRRFPPAGDP
jgi:HAD superfamily hydrolase (TIGR01490 family)